MFKGQEGKSQWKGWALCPSSSLSSRQMARAAGLGSPRSLPSAGDCYEYRSRSRCQCSRIPPSGSFIGISWWCADTFITRNHKAQIVSPMVALCLSRDAFCRSQFKGRLCDCRTAYKNSQLFSAKGQCEPSVIIC